MNMDATVYASRRKKKTKKQAHTWLVNICKKKKKILECFWQGRLYICFVSGRLFLSSVWVCTVSSYYLKKDYLMHLGLISIWIGVNLFCSAQYHIQISPPIIQFHPHQEKKGWNKNLIMLSCFMLARSLTNNLLNSISECLLAAPEWTEMLLNDRWYFSNFIKFRYRDSSPGIDSFWNSCTPCLIYCPCDTEFIVIECGGMKLDCIVCLWLIIPDGIAPHSAWHDAPREKYGSREQES